MEEFNGRIQEISKDTEKIKNFTIFARNNYDRIRQRRLVHGDIKTFTGFLSNFIDKEYFLQNSYLKLFVIITILNFCYCII